LGSFFCGGIKMSVVFTSEGVAKGHPDKVCDSVADHILDAIIELDPKAHSAIEVMASANKMFITGEVKSEVRVDYEKIARETVKEIGYDGSGYGFDYDKIEVEVQIHEQSADIDLGVSLKDDIGAGDQGIMFGYANKETKTYLPCAYDLVCKMMKRLDDIKAEYQFLGPDGKGQVSVAYENGKPQEVTCVVLSNQHREDIELNELRTFLQKEVIEKVIPASFITEKTEFLINPTGRFVIGGPVGDSGLTGRKLVADTYGGYAPHGGGAFSGKDPTKVDRSAAYYGRYVAKNMVAAGLCDELIIQSSYAIGHPLPVSLYLDARGTNKVSYEVLHQALREQFNFRVANILKELDLFKAQYAGLTNYGHFGKEGYRFEELDKVEVLKKYL